MASTINAQPGSTTQATALINAKTAFPEAAKRGQFLLFLRYKTWQDSLVLFFNNCTLVFIFKI